MNNKKSFNLVAFSIAIVCLFLLENTVNAQRRSPTRSGRNSTTMKTTMESLIGSTRDSICELKSGNDRVALGTIVSADGLIVTKLSEVQAIENLKCELADDRKFDVKLIAESDRYDLGLLKIETDGLSAAPLDAGEVELDAGNIVLSANEKGRAISMGITTVPPRRFQMRQPRAQAGRGFLGIECSPVSEGLEIGRVTSGSGAQKAGLRRSDILVELAGKKVPSVAKLIELLEDFSPDDEVEILIAREEEKKTVTVRLGKVPATTGVQDRWGGGPFSERRFGFPTVIAHDCAIKPNDCGGPLLNSDGKVIGINIARALRVSTYAVPIAEVAKFVEQNRTAAEESEK
jgi:serine protease Do